MLTFLWMKLRGLLMKCVACVFKECKSSLTLSNTVHSLLHTSCFFCRDEPPWKKSVVGLNEVERWAAVTPLLTHWIDYIHLIILKPLPLWMPCKSHFPSSSWSISHIRIDFPSYSPRSGRFSGRAEGNIQSKGTVLYLGQLVCSNNADVTWERWALRRSRSWGECTIFKSGLPGSLAPPCGLSMSAHDRNPPLNLSPLSTHLFIFRKNPSNGLLSRQIYAYVLIH